MQSFVFLGKAEKNSMAPAMSPASPDHSVELFPVIKEPSMWHMGRCWNDVSLPPGQSWAGTYSSAHEKCTLWILTTCHDSNTDLDFLLDQLPLCGNENYLLPPAVWQLPVKPSNGEVSSKKANILYNNATVVKWTHAKALNFIIN